MDVQRLRYFVEVVKKRNFSRAAESCRVSQPSLSQQIKKLEWEVGGTLIFRTPKGIKLSPLGEEFLMHAQAILSQVQVAEDFASRSREEMERVIRFAAIPTIAPYFIPQMFAAIREKNPSVKFELYENRTDEIVELMNLGEIDFALLSPPTKLDRHCDAVTLAKDEFLLAIPADHELASAEFISVADVMDERVILLENSHCLAGQVAAYCKEMGLEPDVAMRGAQIDTLLGIVEMNFGVTFIPKSAADYHRHRKVCFKSVSPYPCSREVQMQWLSRQVLSKPLESVIRAIKNMIDKD